MKNIVSIQKLPAEKTYEEYFEFFSQKPLSEIIRNADLYEKSIIEDIKILIDYYFSFFHFYKLNDTQSIYRCKNGEFVALFIAVENRTCKVIYSSPVPNDSSKLFYCCCLKNWVIIVT